MEKKAKRATRTPSKHEPDKRDALVAVYTSSGPLGAEVVKGRLESEGIPAMLKYESAQSVFGLTVDGMGEVRVLVRREDEAHAQRILKAKSVKP